MDKSLLKTLSLLGLNDLEAKFFITSFRLGPASIPDVAKAAKIRRSTAYVIADKLKAENLLYEDHKSYGAKVFTLEPPKLLGLLSIRQRQLRRQEIELEESMPQLLAAHQVSETRPKVTVYEGKSGLLRVWQDILSTKSEILLWTNQESERQIFDTSSHEKFVAQRVARQISIRVLAVDNPAGRKLQETDTQYLRQTKFFTNSSTFTAETYLYDNKIALLDYNKDIIGIIIESLPFSITYKTLFESQWSNS